MTLNPIVEHESSRETERKVDYKYGLGCWKRFLEGRFDAKEAGVIISSSWISLGLIMLLIIIVAI